MENNSSGIIGKNKSAKQQICFKTDYGEVVNDPLQLI